MIDTDKYEGHTEGPWYASEEEMEEGKAWVMRGGEHWVVMDKSDGHLWIEWMKEDAILAADAPLLLAEVKRLREALDMRIALITDVDTMIGEKWNVSQDDWNELVDKHYVQEEEE